MVIPSKPHIVLLASPGLGHLIPIVELAKRFVAQHECTVTVFAVTTEARRAEDELLQAASSSLPGLLNTVVLPNSVHVDPGVGIITRMSAMVRGTLPSLRSSINDMAVKPRAIIVDQFTTEAVKVVAEEFHMLRYVFIASNAWFLAYNSYMPYVQKKVDPNKPFHVPGCESIPGGDLLDITFDPNCSDYRAFVDIGRDIMTVDGILVNTWEDLEPRTLGAFKNDVSMKSIVTVPVYPIGPVIRRPTQVAKTGLVKWLDAQPDESVIYVSFGSGGTISTQQTIELAWGLELSKQRFVWVIRPPNDTDRTGSLFKSVHKNESVYDCLPNGFLDRTRDVGIVVSNWVSQEEILQHRSIGGFVSHCGWNSVLESVANGVPIIVWPLYAEQSMNATMLTENIGIAIRSKVKTSKEIVSREEIGRMVKFVMVNSEGFGLRRKVKDFKMKANQALSEGGSSYCALSQVAKDCSKILHSEQC